MSVLSLFCKNHLFNSLLFIESPVANGESEILCLRSSPPFTPPISLLPCAPINFSATAIVIRLIHFCSIFILLIKSRPVCTVYYSVLVCVYIVLTT